MISTLDLGPNRLTQAARLALRVGAALALTFIAVSIGATLRHYWTGTAPEAPGFWPILAFGLPAGAPLAAALLWIGRPLT
ncbi:MAG: hypothetical protein AAGK03_03485 [Pseudomonadota bacterium]